MEKNKDNLFIILLLVISGNPFFFGKFWVNTSLILSFIIVAYCLRSKITKEYISFSIKYLSVFYIIFFLQNFILGFVSVSFLFGFFIRAFISTLIFYYYGESFKRLFYNVIFVICIISLPFYLAHFISGNKIEIFLQNTIGNNSIGFYTFRGVRIYEGFLRNSGMFGEPGLFQSYINLMFVVNFNELKNIFKFHKYKTFIIILTLISTQSTTGYLIFFIIMFFHIISNVKRKYRLINSFILITLMVILFSNLSFLGEKIKLQYQNVVSNDIEISNDRLGSLMFDFYYIRKHPIIGNGFHEITRYADHPRMIWAIQEGKILGFSNGLSNFIASAGFLGFFWYLYYLWRMNLEKGNRRFLLLYTIIIILLLFGQPLLNYAFFIGLPFLKLKMKSG